MANVKIYQNSKVKLVKVNSDRIDSTLDLHYKCNLDLESANIGHMHDKLFGCCEDICQRFRQCPSYLNRTGV
jgi:hypothetical protein